MKTPNLFYVLIAAFYMCTFAACSDNNSNDIDITVSGIHNPEWLLSRIDDVKSKSDGYRAVFVYSITYNKQEYILILDGMNSSNADGQLLYTSEGQAIAWGTPLYESVLSLFYKKEYTLLWGD